MFRRVESTLEPDAKYPADLKELGYFVNDEGKIKMIEAPEKDYVFHHTNNERHNEMRREAMQICQRAEVARRLSALGLDKLYLPTLSTTKPNGPHVPILAPPVEVLKTRKRVIVIINDTLQDLGILAYRSLQRGLGLNGGSVVNFTKEMINHSREPHHGLNLFQDGAGIDDKDAPGLIVMNNGQLLYSHKYNQTLSLRGWSALPRKSMVHDQVKVHQVENRVEGHRTPQEHIQSVFRDVVLNTDYVAGDAEVYVVAIENGAENLLGILERDFETYGSRITALAVVQSLYSGTQIKNPTLDAFLQQRTRHWRFSGTTSDPAVCTELPAHYSSCKPPTTGYPRPANWLEKTAAGPIHTLSGILNRLTLSTTAPTPEPSSPSSRPPSPGSAFRDQEPLCPTFAGGDDPIGECIFTTPSVQRAILSFFSAVALDPHAFANPPLAIGSPWYTSSTTIPNPTPSNPLPLDPVPTSGFQPADTPTALPAGVNMTPTHAAARKARAQLADMRACLSACPEAEHLAKGRAALVEKIAAKEKKVAELEAKALASGGLGRREEGGSRMRLESLRQRKTEGPKVRFAGAMVDSELVRGAGLLGVVEGEGGREEVRAG
ncbi:hypothetical protein BS50DRAFT_662530 [Corynespora cassiicola Philippines]|uniref:Arb2 domain-containing protein n=1 Tax=Corynespora cassiicola Philippines TaxID=1448308 RepID=A0A2T2NY38_CORCC|nr:hypothetical protein BS50DRAFT_662530 [Corynespora cassiicola Philippines]